MGMHTFDHIAVTSIQDAVAQVGKHRKAAAVVAGGTDILGILKDEVRPLSPRVLVDLKRIKGLDSIVEESGGIRIGALTTLAAITKHKAIRENYPLLADAAHAVASPQLRNMGTIGGNICQEPRCWYYRHLDNVFHCLRKGGEKCPALTGENRFHSIYGSMRVGSPGCCQSCPDNIDIPRYMERIRAGEIAEAGHIILEHNPMPAVTGRVCPHFCEQGCNRNEQDSAVSVRAVERRVGDYVLENAKAYAGSRVKENGRKVAIVGGGPAGLTCAYFLRLAGLRRHPLRQAAEARRHAPLRHPRLPAVPGRPGQGDRFPAFATGSSRRPDRGSARTSRSTASSATGSRPSSWPWGPGSPGAWASRTRSTRTSSRASRSSRR